MINKPLNILSPEQIEIMLESMKNKSEVFNIDSLLKLFPNINFDKVECSEKKVISIDKLNKEVTIFDEVDLVIKPKHFYLKYDGKTIIEW